MIKSRNGVAQNNGAPEMRTLLFLITFFVATVAIFAASCGLVILVVFLFDAYFAAIPEEIGIPAMWIVACLIWIAFSLPAFFKLRRVFSTKTTPDAQPPGPGKT